MRGPRGWWSTEKGSPASSRDGAEALPQLEAPEREMSLGPALLTYLEEVDTGAPPM